METHTRNKFGRYVVKIPIKPNALPIADSRNIALRRFHQLERQLQRDMEMRELYVKFMRDYEALGHMTIADKKPVNGETVYIPHHAIRKKNFRVVFDASSENADGTSLNKAQMVGEKLQFDLMDQIMRFRRHKYGVIADIAKMFRQVNIDKTQWALQRIFWRENPYAQLKEYWLTTVTYGLASAGHCATRAMIQCARDNAKKFPIAAKTIENCFYMDDGLMGDKTIAETKLICREVDLVLKSGGMELRGWNSNSKEVQRIMENQSLNANVDLDAEDDETKVLGLRWLTATDELTIFVKIAGHEEAKTMRKILSGIGKLYDPNGFVAPIVIVAKILMQDIWRNKEIGWDNTVPENIAKRWHEFCKDLEHLQAFRIPRWLTTGNTNIQLHGFCDASSQAYGVVIYIRTASEHGKINCRLLCAKSRVAPIKTLSVPRLELAGAEMLSSLMERVKDICEYSNAKVKLWCDSTIVLHWMRKCPFELKTYVANRIATIQRKTQKEIWSHIASAENPADMISRGMKAEEIVSSDLWKFGPKWLLQPEQQWPKPKLIITPQILQQIEVECKPKNARINVIAQPIEFENKQLIIRFSNWSKILRITAFVLRFVHNARIKKGLKGRIKGIRLTTAEFKLAAAYWIKIAQSIHYKTEIESLKAKDDKYPSNSKIAPLRPILDENGLLRVGGRIGRANCSHNKKHPIIIPPKSRVCWLIMQQAHTNTLHGGVQLMMAYIRNSYWIIRIRSELRQFTNRCVDCLRHAGTTSK